MSLNHDAHDTQHALQLLHSVSGEPARREDVIDMAKFLKGELESLGVKVTMVELGMHTMDGQELPLPPAILGEIGNDKSKKTVCLYAHYDVQPVSDLCHQSI
jgi:Cys-Gly metallodipeptidase DUG1